MGQPARASACVTIAAPLPRAVPDDITGRVAWQQRLVMQNCQALASQGIEPQATWVREGYLYTIRARISWAESLQIPYIPGVGILGGKQNGSPDSPRMRPLRYEIPAGRNNLPRG